MVDFPVILWTFFNHELDSDVRMQTNAFSPLLISTVLAITVNRQIFHPQTRQFAWALTYGKFNLFSQLICVPVVSTMMMKYSFSMLKGVCRLVFHFGLST